MNETTIVIIVIIICLTVLIAGSGWFVFIHLPKTTMSIARESAKAVKDTFGFTPHVTIEQTIIYNQTREILELAIIEEEFDIEHDVKNIWLGSEKQILLRGHYRAKIGFNLRKGVHIEVYRGRNFRANKVIVYLPHAEVLSLEEVGVRKYYSGGWINWISNQDTEGAARELMLLAKDRAATLEMLADAERRITNRLNEFLLPRLTNYSLDYKVKFIENAIEAGQEGKAS